MHSTATNPPGGIWLATQEILWLNGAFEVTSLDHLLADRTSGPNASAAFCRWSPPAA